MSIDYLRDIKPLQDQGISDVNIAVHLNSKTLFPMDPEECKYILQDTGAVLQDPVLINQRSGTLIDYYQSLPSGESKDLIAFFLGRVYGDKPVNVNEYPRSIQFASVESSLPENLQLVTAKLVESAGSRPHKEITEEDVANAKNEWEQAEADRIAEEQAKAEAEAIAREEKRKAEEKYLAEEIKLKEYDSNFTGLYNLYIAPLKDSRNIDSSSWKAGIQSMADAWEF